MKFNKKILKNGLTVLHEKRDVPVTTVMLATKYGSGYEEKSEVGLAHFLEHVCSKGTKKRDYLQISSEVEKLGGMGNAFTAEELTAHYTKIPSKHLKVAMDVLFDVFFNPTFPEEEVEKEGNVILEELKMRRDTPHIRVFDKLRETLYEGPFGESAEQEAKNVKNITRENIKRRHTQTYVPRNSILCVVGDNNFEEIIEFAEKFSVNLMGEEVKMPKIKERLLKITENREGLSQTNLALGFHLPYKDEKMMYALEVFSAILGEGMSSKLFTEVREKRGLVYSVHSDYSIGKHHGYFVISAGTDKSKVEEVEKACLQEYKKMKDITEKELREGKVQVLGKRDVKSENSEDVVVSLILEEIKGDAKNYYEYSKRINAVKLSDIKKLAENIKYSRFILGP